MKKIIWWILFLALFFRTSSHIIINRDYFLRKFEAGYFSDLYSKSQYVLGPASIGGIGDDGLYAFAGYYYFLQGGDVSAVNFEHPPLGKYLIGLSIFLFNNQNAINIFYYLILLYLTYRIGQRVFKDTILAMVSAVILSFDPLFLDHLIRSQLDLPFTLLFTTAVFFFLVSLKREKFLYLTFIFWGMAFSTRFFPLMVIIYFYLLFIIISYSKRSIITFIRASFFIPIIYLVSHISFFVYHPSFVEFLRHKKWMISWYTGTPAIIGNIWRNILTGTYLDSTGKLAVNKYWSIILPIISILGVIRIRKSNLIPNNMELGVVYGLTLIYVIYITFLTNGLQKFIMPIYPLLIILAIHNLNMLYSIINPWRRMQLRSKKKSSREF